MRGVTDGRVSPMIEPVKGEPGETQMATVLPPGHPGAADSKRLGRRSPDEEMRAYWDAKARENAMYYIHSVLDYENPDRTSFWESGGENLDATLGPFGLEISRNDRVVEIGCGIGRMTRAIAMRAAHVTGIDVSVEMVGRARRELADLGNVELVAGNGRDLDSVADSSADVVYSFIVFQHIPDPAVTCAYIREIGRVLRPGGWTVFQVSENEALHRQDTWRSQQSLSRTWRARLAELRRRRPRGCLAPQWLGSALSRAELLEALSEAGLVLDATTGDGTQFCLVHAHRPRPTDAAGT